MDQTVHAIRNTTRMTTKTIPETQRLHVVRYVVLLVGKKYYLLVLNAKEDMNMQYWVCEPCGSKCVSTSPLKEDQGIGSRASKMYQRNKTAKVKLLTGDEVIRLSSGASHPVSSTNVLGKHQRNDEIHKKTMTSKHASCSLSKDVWNQSVTSLESVSAERDRGKLLLLPLGNAPPSPIDPSCFCLTS
ncbi:hypothetical protein VIGAN_02261000 [Vigna angularis var. angularis]|uniref:Uncharacterized protein n=1 Tax=Vigna angularis var. angularis TaxID=157739 RepID=A0A0S3RGA6_PHAAN|nr:hypothetical protein VIGAN_02261000 [Vigna angularis var. angularis]